MGLFAREDEVPYWIHVWDAVYAMLFLWVPMVIAGIVCLVIGNTVGRVIGGVLLVGGVIWGLSAVRRLRTRRDEP